MHQTLESTASSTPAPSEIDDLATVDDLQELKRRLAAPARSELGMRNVFALRHPAQMSLADIAD